MLKNRVNNRSRSFGKVSKKMAEMPIIKVTCGSVKGRLHKNKFYCPGIHRECIEFQGRFITPKMFSVMGDKERLKDWKNALRINGIQVRKYIESGTLDFNRHDEFCTGRCIARSPVNRGSQSVTAAVIPKVEFVSSINEHTYCHLPDDSEHAGLPNIPTVEMRGDPEPVDVKPNVALLQSLLEKPPANTVDVLPPDVAAALSADKDVDSEPLSIDPETAEEDRQFWVGIMELGLLEHFFREIKINLDVYKSDLVTHQVRINDAVRISSVVRSMGLMNKFKKRLASFKSDMDQQQAKIDAEMEALKQQVTQYELRKQALKRKSEKFELLMDMSASKKAFIIEKNVNSDDEGDFEEDDEDNGKEVVDICFENEEDDAMDVSEPVVEEKEEFGEKQITVPRSSTITSPARSVSPVKITTLPSDSSSSYVIKNHSEPQAGSHHVPTFTVSVPPKSEPSKKVTIIRQVLMDTASDGDTMEKLKEAAVMKVKESISSKQEVLDTNKQTVVSPNVANTYTLTVNSASSPKSVPKIQSTAPAKEKIKIIARCKPVVDSETSVVSQRDDIVLPQTTVHKALPLTSSPLTLTPTLLTYNPNKQRLTSTTPANVVEEVKNEPDSSADPETDGNVCKSAGSQSKKDLKVVAHPVEVKKRKPGPKSKTEYFEVNMKNVKESSPDDPSKVTFDSGCQTPIDGVRENPPSLDDKGKPTVSARRSNRKTTHMFSWGMKSGGEAHDSVLEESDLILPDSSYTVEKSTPSDLSPNKDKFTWDLE